MPSELEIESKKFILNHVISPELYFDSIKVYFDFSGITNRNIIVKLKNQLHDLKKYLPILHSKIAELACKAVLTNGPIIIKFTNWQETTGFVGSWNATKKEIYVDYNQEYLSLFKIIGFELCNANNKMVNDLTQPIKTSEYIYNMVKESYNLAIKKLEAEHASHQKLRQIFDEYIKLIDQSSNNEIRDYVNYLRGDTTTIDNCLSELCLKDISVQKYLEKFPEHIEFYSKRLFSVIAKHNYAIMQKEISDIEKDQGANKPVDMEHFISYLANVLYLDEQPEPNNHRADSLISNDSPSQEFSLNLSGDNFENQNH